MEENGGQPDLKSLMREVLQEFAQHQQSKAEPVQQQALQEERRRREQLERRVNELVEENKRSRAVAEQTERHAAIRSELQRLGVSKVDLAFKAVRDEVLRAEDGRLMARTPEGETNLREYLTHFVAENPELLPARVAGGSGAGMSQRSGQAAMPLDLDRIKPGMSAEELERVRQEIARVASQGTRQF